jgi:hypothetical protein
MPGPVLVEGIDYTVGDDGLLVFTAYYLKARGFCCNNGCRNCPYRSEPRPPDSSCQSGGEPFEKSPPDR